MEKSILLHAWTLYKKGDKYYIPYTHWVYLNEIVEYYDRICLLSPTKEITDEISKYVEISFINIEIYELPYSDGYIDAIKNFLSYVKAYKLLSKKYNTVYARYPIPFGWLQLFFFPGRRRIIHFVGDPIDTIINNPNLSSFKKFLYQVFFKPEHHMFIRACKEAEVYTNGYHIAERLLRLGIHAKALVSSTLNTSDFYFDANKKISGDGARIIYVGYLRKAKGVETIVKACALLSRIYPNLSLSIVGHGEMEEDLKNLAQNLGIKNINFFGHIDNREELNNVLRENDIFAFASHSEGSPRVILEAMANGLAVVSTPVGSLPHTFENKKDILFAKVNNEEDFSNKISELINNSSYYNELRKNSYKKVLNFKIDNFLKEIFYEA